MKEYKPALAFPYIVAKGSPVLAPLKYLYWHGFVSATGTMPQAGSVVMKTRASFKESITRI